MMLMMLMKMLTMVTLITMPMITKEKLKTMTAVLMDEKLTSSSLLWLPDRSSWLDVAGSNRLLLEATATILEDPSIILEEGLLERFDSKMSPAGAITTSLATSLSGRTTWDIILTIGRG